MDKNRIKSVQFIDTYIPIVDGVVETVHNYATVMNRQAPTAVVFPSPKKPFAYSRLKYETVPVRKINGIVPFDEYTLPNAPMDKYLHRYLLDFDADIFHVHSPVLLGSYAVDYAKKHKIPCVVTFHSKYFDDVLNVTKSRLLANIAVKYIVSLYKRADSVWACSEGTAETLRSYGYKGDIFVMDNGTAYHFSDEKREELRCRAIRELDMPEGVKTIFFAGHLFWHKNLRLVLDAFRMLCDRDDGYQLLIAGEGYDGEEIKKYAASLNFAPGKVRFLGNITDRNLLAGMFAYSDLFFFPSVYDNSPLVVREAAALGLPSLLTEGTNAAEVVEKDVNGFTAPEDPAAMCAEILRIFSEDGLKERAGEEARRTIPKSWEKVVDAVRTKYAEIIDEYRGTHGPKKKKSPLANR